MKRRCLCVICLVLYMLISCTILSLKIEEEMLTQVEVLRVKSEGLWGQSVTISQTVLFEDAYGQHLYELVEGSGWESGLRVREIPQDSYALDYEKGTIRLSGGRDYCFITTASRQPAVGELVQIVEAGKEQAATDQLLFVYPEGVPNELQISADIRILERSTNAVLAQADNKDTAFFEHKLMHRYQAMAGKDWCLFSMPTVEGFMKQLPLVAVVVSVMVCIIFLWLYSFFICTHSAHFGKMVLLPGIASILSIAAVYIILSFIDLPAAVLPEANILHFDHYASELRTVSMGLDTLSHYGVSFREFYSEIIKECLIIFSGTLTITIVFIAVSIIYKHYRIQ